MDLAQLGSADMEQLLQGINIDELMGSQLFPGAVEPGTLGTNAHDVLLRIMESPGLLHQVLHGGGGGGTGIGGGGGPPGAVAAGGVAGASAGAGQQQQGAPAGQGLPQQGPQQPGPQ
jgi:hypothetical protein